MMAMLLGTAALEQLFNTGKTLGNIFCRCDTAGMEGTHGQLGTGLADGLLPAITDRLRPDGTGSPFARYRRRSSVRRRRSLHAQVSRLRIFSLVMPAAIDLRWRRSGRSSCLRARARSPVIGVDHIAHG